MGKLAIETKTVLYQAVNMFNSAHFNMEAYGD